MHQDHIDFSSTHAFSSFFLDYIQEKEVLKKFYTRFPKIELFGDQLSDKSKQFSQQHRNTLVSVLNEQYRDVPAPTQVLQNIESLGDGKTFTIVTGHQLNIFTGPLYFIYKIVTVINTCRALSEKYPGYKFVPVYWMASEDHDYEEIKYFRLYGKKYVWNTNQTGAVGRFSTEGFKALMTEIPGDIEIFRKAYLTEKTLAGAVRHYVNALFGEQGLVVIDADHAELKKQFAPVMREDIFENISKDLVDQTNAALEEAGYKTQVFCREINFFYLTANQRHRLEREVDGFRVVDTTTSFDRLELQSLIENHPERFSPNVILRPLYQEVILPNLAYVGGPAEVVYWLQLKAVFAHFEVPFPILMPRNFAMVIDQPTQRKLEKTKLELSDFFETKNYLFNHWVLKFSEKNLSVEGERKAVLELFKAIRARCENVDSTLGPLAGAEETRTLKSLDKIEHKLLRAEKRRQSEKLAQIEAVKDALFPGGSLQERTDNFLNFYQQDAAFIQRLLDRFDPFDFRFNILRY